MPEVCAYHFHTSDDPTIAPLFRIPCESLAALASVQRQLLEGIAGSYTGDEGLTLKSFEEFRAMWRARMPSLPEQTLEEYGEWASSCVRAAAGKLIIPGQGHYNKAVEEGIATRVPRLTVQQAIAYHADPAQPIPSYAGRVAGYPVEG